MRPCRALLLLLLLAGCSKPVPAPRNASSADSDEKPKVVRNELLEWEKQLLTGTPQRRREAFERMLADEEGFERLSWLMKDPSSRAFVFACLPGGGKKGKQLLALALVAEDSDVRLAAWQAMDPRWYRDQEARRQAARKLCDARDAVEKHAALLFAILNDKDDAVSRTASAALVRAGAKAVPLLLDEITRGGGKRAGAVLVKIGEPAVEPLLQRLEKHSGTGANPFRPIVFDLGPIAIPHLGKRLASDNRMSQVIAARLLADMTADTRPIRPHILAALAGDSFPERGVLLSLLAAEKDNRDLASFWAAELQRPEASGRKQAVAAIAVLGRNALPLVPVLVQAMSDKDLVGSIEPILSGFGADALPVLVEMGRHELHPATVIRLLAGLGPKAAPAASFLVAALGKKTSDRRACVRALARIGKPAVPALREAMKGGGAVARAYAALTLHQIEKDPTPVAMDLLIAALKSPDEEARSYLIEQIEAIGPEARSALPVLRRWTRDKGGRFQSSSRKALMAIAPADPDCVLDYLDIAFTSEPWMDNKALRALLQCKARLPQLLPLIVAAYRKDRGNQDAPLQLIEAIGPEAALALPVLLADLKRPPRLPLGLEHFSGKRAVALLRAVGSIGQAAAPAVGPLLAELKRNRNVEGDKERAIIDALAKIGRPALPLLLKEVRANPPPRPRFRDYGYGDKLARVLAQMADVPIKDLENAYFDARWQDRQGFADLIGKRGKAALPVLIAILRQKVWSKNEEESLNHSSTRKIALAYIERLGGQASAAVPTLSAVLREQLTGRAGGIDIKKPVLQALTAIGPAAKKAVAPIVQVLEKWDMPDAALDALAAIGEGARPAVPLLVRIAANKHDRFKDKSIQQRAAITLTKIDPKEARPFFPLLLATAKALRPMRDHPRFRDSVREAERREHLEAMLAIGRLGPLDEKSVAALGDYLRTAVYVNALSVCGDTIRAQGKQAAAVIPTLLQGIQKDIDGRRIYLVRPLGFALSQAPDQLARLRPLLRSRNPIWALRAAYHAGPSARPLKEDVMALLADKEAVRRAWAHHALHKMDLGAQLLPVWARSLRDSEPAIRQTALEAITACGRSASGLAGRVEPFLRSSVEQERSLALAALRVLAPERIGVQRKAAWAVLSDPKAPKRPDAARFLLLLGADARSESDLLVKLLDDSDKNIQIAAMQTIATFQPPLVEALPKLLMLARPEMVLIDGKRRIAALGAIGAMGPAAKSAVGFLESVVREDARRMLQGQQIRQAATAALGNLGAAARPALPLLRNLLADEQAQKARGMVWSNTFIGDVLPKTIQQIETAKE